MVLAERIVLGRTMLEQISPEEESVQHVLHLLVLLLQLLDAIRLALVLLERVLPPSNSFITPATVFISGRQGGVP